MTMHCLPQRLNQGFLKYVPSINISSNTRVNIFKEIPALFVYFLTQKYISWLFIQTLVSIPFIFVSIHFPKCKLEPQAKSAWIFLKLECYVSFLLLIPKIALLKEFKVSFILFSLSKKNCADLFWDMAIAVAHVEPARASSRRTAQLSRVSGVVCWTVEFFSAAFLSFASLWHQSSQV